MTGDLEPTTVTADTATAAATWPALELDASAVREWLDDPAVRAEVIGADADLPDYPDFQDDAQAFIGRVDDIVTHASDDGLLGQGDRLRVYFTPTCDTSGVMDGGIVSVDWRPQPGGDTVRFASAPQDHADLIDDPTATGIDAAVSILAAVARTAAWVLADAGRILGLTQPTTVADLMAALGVYGVNVRGYPQRPGWGWCAEARVSYIRRGGVLDGTVDSELVQADGTDLDGAVRNLDAVIRARFVPGGRDPQGDPCALLRPDAPAPLDGSSRG